MDQFYLWCLTGVAGLLSANTLWRLVSEKQRFTSEDLGESDRAFAWRVVIFLGFPLLNYLDMRATIISCELLGGYVKSWSYGLFWYNCLPSGISNQTALAIVLFAGLAVQLALAISLLPALFFRPHPFLATIVGYWVSFTFVFNLVLDPLMTLAGMGSPRWQWLYASGNPATLKLLAAHLAVLALVSWLANSNFIRLWFARLTRPFACEQLQNTLALVKSNPKNLSALCQLSINYQRAGLRKLAQKQLGLLNKQASGSLYYYFLDALLAYRQREYTKSWQGFRQAAQYPGVEGKLRADLLAAAACAAFAAGKPTEAVNLSEQALEFSDNCTTARMVKVDVLLQQGKKDLAGQEILLAMRNDSMNNLEDKIPLDSNSTLTLIDRLQESKATMPVPEPLVISL